ncbi:unnamed protein product [Musa hybrid cultivar]
MRALGYVIPRSWCFGSPIRVLVPSSSIHLTPKTVSISEGGRHGEQLEEDQAVPAAGPASQAIGNDSNNQHSPVGATGLQRGSE